MPVARFKAATSAESNDVLESDAAICGSPRRCCFSCRQGGDRKRQKFISAKNCLTNHNNQRDYSFDRTGEFRL
jgi:hypothetical protein